MANPDAADLGSSPQVRRPRVQTSQTGQRTGLIPAGAGTTLSLHFLSCSKRAHPRRCGDHPLAGFRRRWGLGSSPQVRGPLGVVSMISPLVGLIPAGAGTTELERAGLVSGGAHPRRCGDHRSATIRFLESAGSSPQVRGPRTESVFDMGAIGLIPAGAGTTLSEQLAH